MNYTKKNIIVISCIILVSTLSFSQTETKRATSIRQIIPSKVEMTYTKAIILNKKQNSTLEEGKTNLDNFTKANTAINTKQLLPCNLSIVAIPVDKRAISQTNKSIQKITSEAKKIKSSTTMTFEKEKD